MSVDKKQKLFIAPRSGDCGKTVTIKSLPYSLNLTAKESSVLNGWRYPLGWGHFSINLLRQVVYLQCLCFVVIFWAAGVQGPDLTSFGPLFLLFIMLCKYYGFAGLRQLWTQKHNFENIELRRIIYLALLTNLLIFGAIGLTNILIGLASGLSLLVESVPFCEPEISVHFTCELCSSEDLQRIFWAIIFWFSALLFYSSGAWLQTINCYPLYSQYKNSKSDTTLQVGQIAIWFLGFILKHFAVWGLIFFVVEWVMILNSPTMVGLSEYSVWPLQAQMRGLLGEWPVLIAGVCGCFVLEGYLTIMPTSMFKSLYYILLYYRAVVELVSKVFSIYGWWFSRIVWGLLLFGVFVYYVFLLFCFIYPSTVTPTAGILVKLLHEYPFLLIDESIIKIRTQVFTFWGYYTILSLPGLLLFLRPVYFIWQETETKGFSGETTWVFESSLWFPEVNLLVKNSLAARNEVVLVYIKRDWFAGDVLKREWSTLNATTIDCTSAHKTLLAELPLYVYNARTGNCDLIFCEWGLPQLSSPGVLFILSVTKGDYIEVPFSLNLRVLK